MDDASPDNTDQVIRELIPQAPKGLHVEYLRNEVNIGLNSQLNKLVDRFENKLIVLQAGDDESYPCRLEETYNAWVANNKPSLLLANHDNIDDDGVIIKSFNSKSKQEKPYTLKRLINRRSKVYGCCAAYHSDLINFFGEVPKNVINEDRINAFRAYFQNGIIYLHKPLIKYRSEVGISAFNTSTVEQQHHRMTTEAKRELADIDSHLLDLPKIKNNTKVEKLLLKRKISVSWLSTLPSNLSLSDALKALVMKVNFRTVIRTYKKMNK
jgi:glycosyltransferase involved in cell wall biosynthesis